MWLGVTLTFLLLFALRFSNLSIKPFLSASNGVVQSTNRNATFSHSYQPEQRTRNEKQPHDETASASKFVNIANSKSSKKKEGLKTVPSKLQQKLKVKDILDDLMVVSGFWLVPDNPKHGEQVFKSNLRLTFDYLKVTYPHVTFFHGLGDDLTADFWLDKLILDHQDYFKMIHANPSETFFNESQVLIQQCAQQAATKIKKYPKSTCLFRKNKFPRHIRRYRRAPQAWRHVLAIWIAKFHYVKQAIENTTYPYYVWIDGGIGGWANKNDKFFWRKVHEHEFDPRYIYALDNMACAQDDRVNDQLKLVAKYMLGGRQAWLQLIDKFYKKLYKILKTDFKECIDEEIILTWLFNDDKSADKLFRPLLSVRRSSTPP